MTQSTTYGNDSIEFDSGVTFGIGNFGMRYFHLSDGKVGITETEPQAKLHLGGTPGVDGIMFPDGTLQTTAAMGVGDGHSLDAADGDPKDAIFVDTDGNVGIGTNKPEAALAISRTMEGAATLLLPYFSVDIGDTTECP